MECKAIEPAFGIFERRTDIRPSEAFVIGSIRIRFQAFVDERALVVTQKFGVIRIVCDEIVSTNSNDDSHKPFLQLKVSFQVPFKGGRGTSR